MGRLGGGGGRGGGAGESVGRDYWISSRSSGLA